MRTFGCGYEPRACAAGAACAEAFEPIVGESFAEIFFGNCVTIGLPCVTMDPEHVESLQALLDEAPDAELTVDIDAQRVVTDQGAYPAAVPASARASFLTGRWDALGQLLENADEVQATSARPAVPHRIRRRVVVTNIRRAAARPVLPFQGIVRSPLPLGEG